MLKVLPTTVFNNVGSAKCAEIYCQSPTDFTILCTFCEMKSFEFDDFLLHFKNIHFENSADFKTEEINIECTSEENVNEVQDEEEDVLDSRIMSCKEEAQTLEELGMEQEPSEKLNDYNDPYESHSEDDIQDPEYVPKEDFEDDLSSAKLNPDHPFKCTHCERSYKSRQALSTHCSRKHNITRIKADPNAKKRDIWECETCPRIYKGRSALGKHLRAGCDGTPGRNTAPSVHKTNSPIGDPQTETIGDSPTDDVSTAASVEHKCTECGEVFRRELNLRSHMFKHTGIVCDVCGKSFTQVGNMNRHKMRHTGIKAHKCTECDSCFFTFKELKAHMIRHTNIFPHICDVCGRRCRDHGFLTLHMRRHTGERPAECKVCGKRFFCGHDLNVHSVTHTTERPFKCDVCGATFQLKKSLRVHKKLHSTERNHECKVCGKAFAQSSGLVSHMRSHDATDVRGVKPACDAVSTVGVAGLAGICEIFS